MRTAKESQFRARTDAERGITRVTYKCELCGATQAIGFFTTEPILDSAYCVDCRRHDAMVPQLGNGKAN